MSKQTWVETLISSYTDGPALTAAARASCIPTAKRPTFPNLMFEPGKILRVELSGRISCAVTTPGTGRFDICLGAAGSVIVFDSLAFNLNVVAKVNVHFVFVANLICRADGAGVLTTFMPHNCYFESEALVGSPLPTVGGAGEILLPVGTPPAVGGGIDNNAASILDVFWTPSLGTASLQVHNLIVELGN